MIDTSKLNSPSKGHYVNGMRKTFYRPGGYRFRHSCACTRTYRCPRHELQRLNGELAALNMRLVAIVEGL